MKPIIGIIGRPNFPDDKSSLICVAEYYRKAIVELGGIPLLILPPQIINYNLTKASENIPLTEEEKEIILNQLKLCDGILIPGGYKVFEHDFYILDYLIKKDIPTLGICLGMQIMSNYEQKYWNEKNDNTKINHNQEDEKYVHKVKICEGTMLKKIIKEEEINVNSLHNYHVIKSGMYKINALSEDGIIEGLELENKKFNIGVQWHPERLYAEDTNNRILIKAFIEAAKKSRQK